jgi:peptidyl-prolyl cis-trans isomerase D
MRNNKRILNVFLWLVIFAFLATIFVVWGIGDQSAVTQNYVAKIGNYTVTQDEYKAAYDNALANLQAQGGSAARDDNFTRGVIDNLINRKLFLFEAGRLGIPVSDDEVRAVIEMTPAFSRNGYFSIEIYQNALQYNGLTPDMYENMVRQDITASKYLELIGAAAAVSEEEIAIEHKFSFTKAAISYFTVSAGKYRENLNPSEAELATFYETVKERYREPVKIKLKYAEFTPAEFEFVPEITDEMLKDRYAAKLADYLIPEMLDLFQIVVFVNDWDNASVVSAANEKIQKASDELKAGAAFDAVRKKYSEDRNAGAVGTISKSSSPSELENKLFALKDGEFSEIERADYGFSIFKADNRTAARLISFDDAKAALKEGMESEIKEKAYRDYVYAFYRNILSAGNITAFEAENAGALKVKTTEFLSRNDVGAFFANDPALADSLFSLGRSDISQIVDTPYGSSVYELIERVESRIPPLQEIATKVLEDYRLDAAFKSAVKDVEAKIPDSADSKDFQKLAANFGEKITTLPPFRRIDSTPEFAWAANLSVTIFKKAAGDVVKFPEQDALSVYVVLIDEVTPPPAEIPAEDKAAITSYLSAVKRTDAFNGAVKELRGRYKVDINPLYLQ